MQVQETLPLALAQQNEELPGGSMLYYDLLTNVTTPRPDLASQLTNGSVTSILESQSFQLAVAEYNFAEKSFDNTLFTAKQIANVIHQAVTYESMGHKKATLSGEAIGRTHKANCIESALLISAGLTFANIPHYIAHTNTHTLILLEDASSHRYGLINTDSRAFTGDITGAISGTLVADQLGKGANFADVILDTKHLQNNPLLEKTERRKMDKFAWLSFRDKDDLRVGADDQLLQMRVFSPKIGQHVLRRLYNVNSHINSGDLDSLAADWDQLSGLYPDIDPRTKPYLLNTSITLFQKAGRYGDALSVAKAFDSSLTNQNKLMLVYPDAVRSIGNIACLPNLVEVARDLYKELPEAAYGRGGRHGASRNDKLKSVEKQLLNMQT